MYPHHSQILNNTLNLEIQKSVNVILKNTTNIDPIVSQLKYNITGKTHPNFSVNKITLNA